MVESYRCLCGLFPAEIGAAVLAALSIFLQVGDFVNALLKDKFDLGGDLTVEYHGALAIKAIIVILCILVIVGTICKNSTLFCPFLLLNPIIVILLTVNSVLFTMQSTKEGKEHIAMDLSVRFGVFFLLPIAVLIWMEMVVWTARKYVNRFYP